MNTSIPPIAAPADQLPVTSLAMTMVSIVPIVLQVTVFTRLLFEVACQVPVMWLISKG